MASVSLLGVVERAMCFWARSKTVSEFSAFEAILIVYITQCCTLQPKGCHNL